MSLPASDIWALGCIIFKMHTGRTPFGGFSEHQLFMNILSRNISTKEPEGKLSDELDPITLDLIERMMQLNPKKRLGAGRPGSTNDFEALRKHEYFKNIYGK